MNMKDLEKAVEDFNGKLFLFLFQVRLASPACLPAKTRIRLRSWPP